MYTDYFESPLGVVEVTANNKGVSSIYFVDTQQAVCPNELTNTAIAQLQEYFAGSRETFDLLQDVTGTVFQQKVWQALTTIPYGKTVSYQDIADTIGSPKAVRAVGLANGKNPLSIVVPCHRVIGKNGQLTGYAGGIERKLELLKLEGALLT